MSSKCAGKHDDPWRWMIVVAAFVGLFITLGLLRAVGIFYTEWLNYFEGNSSATSTLGILATAVLTLSSSFANTLATRFSDRPVVIAGGLLTSIGFMASAFAPHLYVLFATYGVITGFGLSLSLMPLRPAVVHYFKAENAGLAVGIASSGLGLGGIVFPFLLEYLIDVYGWRGTFIILSGLSLNTCVCGALLRPTPTRESTKVNLKRSFKNIYTNRSFLLLNLHMVFIAMGTQISIAHIKAAILEMVAVNDSAAAYGISMISAGDFIGVLIFGIIFKRHRRFDVVSTVISLYMLMTISLLVFPHVQLYPVLMTLCTLIGFGLTPQVSMMPLVLCQFVGLEDLTLSFGCLNIAYGVGTLLGPLLAGFTYDNTGNYANSFYISGVSIVVGNLFLLQPCISHLREKKLSSHITIEQYSPVSTKVTNVNGLSVTDESNQETRTDQAFGDKEVTDVNFDTNTASATV